MSKKVTIKEIEQRMNVLAYNINHLKMALDNLSFAFAKYIDFNGNASEFKKHLESLQNVNKLEEDVKNNTK